MFPSVVPHRIQGSVFFPLHKAYRKTSIFCFAAYFLFRIHTAQASIREGPAKNQPSITPPSYRSFAPQFGQNCFAPDSRAPHFEQKTNFSCQGAQSTHCTASTLNIISDTHFPQLAHRLKCFRASPNHASASSSCGVSARMGSVIYTAIPELSQ